LSVLFLTHFKECIRQKVYVRVPYSIIRTCRAQYTKRNASVNRICGIHAMQIVGLEKQDSARKRDSTNRKAGLNSETETQDSANIK
jgi:hypothetical protein